MYINLIYGTKLGPLALKTRPPQALHSLRFSYATVKLFYVKFAHVNVKYAESQNINDMTKIEWIWQQWQFNTHTSIKLNLDLPKT